MVCDNVKGCPKVAFQVPKETDSESDSKSKPYNESNLADVLMEEMRGKEVKSLGGPKEATPSSECKTSHPGEVHKISKSSEASKADKTEL